MGHTRYGDVALEVGVMGVQMAVMHAQVGRHLLELVVWPLLRLVVARLVTVHDVAVLGERDPLVACVSR
jgi:hypothetical protein